MKQAPVPFTSNDIDDIKQAIMLAELDTSAEIHVHLENNCSGDCDVRARELFEELHLDKTVEHNGILIYLSVANKRFCICTDTGIQMKAPADFWVMIKQDFLNQIRNENYTDGLIEVIHQTGIHLKKLFPRKPGAVNQLPDDVTFG
jgi:uncharacterized membrane protein